VSVVSFVGPSSWMRNGWLAVGALCVAACAVTLVVTGFFSRNPPPPPANLNLNNLHNNMPIASAASSDNSSASVAAPVAAVVVNPSSNSSASVAAPVAAVVVDPSSNSSASVAAPVAAVVVDPSSNSSASVAAPVAAAVVNPSSNSSASVAAPVAAAAPFRENAGCLMVSRLHPVEAIALFKKVVAPERYENVNSEPPAFPYGISYTATPHNMNSNGYWHISPSAVREMDEYEKAMKLELIAWNQTMDRIIGIPQNW
jgi:hypothetical protein